MSANPQPTAAHLLQMLQAGQFTRDQFFRLAHQLSEDEAVKLADLLLRWANPPDETDHVTSRFYVSLLTNFENPNEGIIRVDVELSPDAHMLSEFPSREQAEAFAESAAMAFENAGMIVVYDPD